MSVIKISKSHPLPIEEGQAIFKTLALSLRDEYSLKLEWVDDYSVIYTRSGVKVTVEMKERDIHISAKLGLVMKPLKLAIEHGIHDLLEEEFQAK